MIASDVDELPMIFTAYRFQVVNVFCLKGLVVAACIAARGKFVCKIFFEFL